MLQNIRHNISKNLIGVRLVLDQDKNIYITKNIFYTQVYIKNKISKVCTKLLRNTVYLLYKNTK
jgi:hypothetical protein